MDLSHIAVVDQHAHNLMRPEVMAQKPLAAAFTEGQAEAIAHHHARWTLCFQRSMREIGSLLGCEPTEAAIRAQREALGPVKLTQRCFEAAGIHTLLMDDGFLPDAVLPLSWHQQFVPVHRLLRLEWLAEQMIAQVNRFEVFLEWFRSELETPPTEVVGFKSIVAYRTGLDIQPPVYDEAKTCFDWLQQRLKATNADPSQATPIRLMEKPLIDYLLHLALEIAAQTATPVQFHTGFGDPDLDLRLANPLHLRSLFENPHYQSVPMVLLHAAYPFMAEVGYLAAVYPQVYVDFGLAVPFLSVAGMRRTVSQLLELSPLTKVMYSSDAHFIPELYYLGALWGRRVLGDVLEQALQDGDLTPREAEEGAIAILQQNALSLYFKPTTPP